MIDIVSEHCNLCQVADMNTMMMMGEMMTDRMRRLMGMSRRKRNSLDNLDRSSDNCRNWSCHCIVNIVGLKQETLPADMVCCR